MQIGIGMGLTHGTNAGPNLPANQLRNPTFTGGIAGTPGTAPTNWTVTATTNSVTRTLAFGSDADGAYIEIKYAGTPNATSNKTIQFEANTQIAALVGQVWRLSVGTKLTAGALTNATVTQRVSELNSGGTGLVSTSTGITPTSTKAIVNVDRTLSSGTVAFVNGSLRIDYTSGNAFDLTLRIYSPSMTRLS